MIGKQISEGKGKRTGRRVVATDPHMKIEATVEETMRVMGVDGMAIITYTAYTKPDGSLHGEGDGVFASVDGETVTWRGIGVGQFGEGGSVRYCGAISFITSSQKFASLNGVAGVFQWEIDAQGNTHSKIWEMAPTGATQTAGA